jgi:hypothetical protein
MVAQADPALRSRPAEALRLDLLGLPVFEPHPELPPFEMPRRYLARLVERRLLRKLREIYEAAASDALARFGWQLRDWGANVLGRLAEQFAAETDPLRALARRAVESDTGPTDRATVATDLAELERFLIDGREGACG